MGMESVNQPKLLPASSDEGFHFKCDPCEYEGNNRTLFSLQILIVGTR